MITRLFLSLSDNTRGALLMMASMAAFTLNDALMKSLAGIVPLFQLLFLRGVMATGMTGVLAVRGGALRARVGAGDWALIAVRVGAEISAAYFFLNALFVAPIANVTAILQCLPLVVTLAAALLFRETIGWRRLSAILVGFVGVLLIIRPGTDGFDRSSLYVLAAVASITTRDLATRRLSSAVPSMLVTFVSAAGVMLFFGVLMTGQEWVTMNVASWSIIGMSAPVILAAYVSSIAVMRVGEISFVSPFRYTSLVWALILGWLVFGEWPDMVTLIGAVIVVGSGVFMLYREGQIARAARARVG
ncbi:DMT family transporter [Thalassovita mediterranea]|jgi:S-adenosylmethionine uptake transporter|uniref:Phosphonate utilization associated putative membrane protein n=1 Tax=Thalassovita mediterranea TaxID=340021 RepID=A0A0P1H0H9_9RHOB|nr:DMT family transporter [Thalassovita mediterranea]CUH83497.1 phosphonate utilization associated putative membrane protein [Thalassovita mediterranea]SIS34498.1 S-adenosylmethionine uptake transporter [Thalassovita mediterranea]